LTHGDIERKCQKVDEKNYFIPAFVDAVVVVVDLILCETAFFQY